MTRRAFFALALLPWWPKPSPPAGNGRRVAAPFVWVVPSLPRDPCAQPGCPYIACHGPGFAYPLCGFHAELHELIRETVHRGVQTGEFDRVMRQVYGR